MSRSRRAPVWVEGYGTKGKSGRKRSAAKAVRAADDVPTGGTYRKVYNPWDICDFKIYDPKSSKVRRK